MGLRRVNMIGRKYDITRGNFCSQGLNSRHLTPEQDQQAMDGPALTQTRFGLRIGLTYLNGGPMGV